MKNYKYESCNKIIKYKSHYGKYVNNKKKSYNVTVIQNIISSKNPPKSSPSSNLELIFLKTSKII